MTGNEVFLLHVYVKSQKSCTTAAVLCFAKLFCDVQKSTFIQNLWTKCEAQYDLCIKFFKDFDFKRTYLLLWKLKGKRKPS